jgi:hypothetical protein
VCTISVMGSQGRWQRGDVVVIRELLETRCTRAYEELTGDHTPNLPGWPHIVLADTEDRVALYCPEGTPVWRWNILEQRLREPYRTEGESVRLLFPGKPFTVTCLFETGTGPPPHVRYYFMGGERMYSGARLPDWGGRQYALAGGRFYGWKVDLISPASRNDFGFDVSDAVLDVVVRPDRFYKWKDMDEMARLIELGIYSQAEADELYEAGGEVVALIERGLSPFDDEWMSWRPSPDLAFVPEAVDGWQYLPVANSEWGALHRQMNPGSYL